MSALADAAAGAVEPAAAMSTDTATDATTTADAIDAVEAEDRRYPDWTFGLVAPERRVHLQGACFDAVWVAEFWDATRLLRHPVTGHAVTREELVQVCGRARTSNLVEHTLLLQLNTAPCTASVAAVRAAVLEFCDTSTRTAVDAAMNGALTGGSSLPSTLLASLRLHLCIMLHVDPVAAMGLAATMRAAVVAVLIQQDDLDDPSVASSLLEAFNAVLQSATSGDARTAVQRLLDTTQHQQQQEPSSHSYASP